MTLRLPSCRQDGRRRGYARRLIGSSVAISLSCNAGAVGYACAGIAGMAIGVACVVAIGAVAIRFRIVRDYVDYLEDVRQQSRHDRAFRRRSRSGEGTDPDASTTTPRVS